MGLEVTAIRADSTSVFQSVAQICGSSAILLQLRRGHYYVSHLLLSFQTPNRQRTIMWSHYQASPMDLYSICTQGKPCANLCTQNKG